MPVVPMIPRLTAQIHGVDIYPDFASHQRWQMTIPKRFAS
jgi:hypothetical protein